MLIIQLYRYRVLFVLSYIFCSSVCTYTATLLQHDILHGVSEWGDDYGGACPNVVRTQAQNSSGITHLACIMDGNRRWAKERGKPSWEGHRKGFEAVQVVIDFCLKNQIPYLSLYTFSIENLERSEEEKDAIFKLVKEGMGSSHNIRTLIDKGVHVRFVGDTSLFPEEVRSIVKKIERKTKDLDTLHLDLQFCYGGRQELAHAARKVAKEVKKSNLALEDITDKILGSYLWTAGIPDPDLIIRTGGYQRLSNFLLFQAAYSELYFAPLYWPDLTENDLCKAVEFFKESQRKFGK